MQISGSGNSAMLQQMQAMRSQMFQKADADKSGGLNLDEFKVAGQNMPGGTQGSKSAGKVEEAFKKIDTNGDGNLTSDEMEAFKPKFDMNSMSALLGAQEASQSAGSDPANELLKMLNSQDANESGGSQSSEADDLVSQLMDMLNASSQKSAKSQDLSDTSNRSSIEQHLTRAYDSLFSASQSGSSMNLAA
jgi:Ca2+-binding EF-hand superfamily protein